VPVAGLLVEGKLDKELLTAVLQGRPAVEVGGGGKYALPHAARHRKPPMIGQLAYVRDRDFDADPPEDTTRPVRVSHGDGVLGWTWCRHEIENYLLQPALVGLALGCDAAEFGAALTAAATAIRDYAAARWAVGATRRSLPPGHALATKPDELSGRDFRLPDELSAEATQRWLRDHTATFRERVCPQLDDAALEPTLQRYRTILADALAGAASVLIWFPGKDLSAALTPWLATRQLDAGRFRERLRDWFVEHPEQALEILGEWRELVAALRETD
jgi:hypothetical protein